MNVYVAEFISLLLAISAIAIVRVRDLFALVILLSVYSALLAALLSFLGAVDVSFTEAVVGTGVSTVFTMALIWRIDPNQLTRASQKRRIFSFAISLLLFVALLFGINELPIYGDPLSPGQLHVAPEYVSGSIELMHTPNVVTAVLADFRGFDTLIETAVVLTALLGCLLVLRKRDDSSL